MRRLSFAKNSVCASVNGVSLLKFPATAFTIWWIATIFCALLGFLCRAGAFLAICCKPEVSNAYLISKIKITVTVSEDFKGAASTESVQVRSPVDWRVGVIEELINCNCWLS